jgi:phenylacetate-coenzyme A ligase PaaK-like adenylate-forming protein
MKKIILGLTLLILISCSEQKEPNYLKLIENCADSLSEKARKEEAEDYRKLLNSLKGGESPTFKKQYKDRIKSVENLHKLPFKEKKTYLIYMPALYQCEKSWERDPIAFKSRWE